MEAMKLLPPVERPREKMQLNGAGSMDDWELLAIVLRSGSFAAPIEHICTGLLRMFPLTELMTADVKQLCSMKGIGEVKALTLLAIVEISKRLYCRNLIRLASNKAVAEHVRPILATSDGLCYLVLLMTADRELLAIADMGSILPDLAKVLRLATDAGARRIQLCRNGWLNMGRLEIQFMRNLELACGTMGIIVYELLTIGEEILQIL